MNLIDPILNTALLGTAARELPVADFPEELQEVFVEIKGKAEDAEVAFYQMSALGFAYGKAGSESLQLTDCSEIVEAVDDEKGYFTREACELLLSLIAGRNPYLLLYAYRCAVRSGKLILPGYLQTLLAHAFERTNPDRREEQSLLPQLTGNRGQWLLPMMGLPVWGAGDNVSWETASHEQRKQLLQEARRVNPATGLALLQTELKNESAAHREDLIQCLCEKLNPDDEAFLQEVLATDRSSNVKEVARRLLCSLPDSEQVKYYCGLLHGKLHYNGLLGWSYDKIEFTPEMKKMGLLEVSSVKNEKDDRFLLRQLAERVPLSFWCEFYDCGPEKAAVKLAKNPPFQNYFQIWEPIVLFHDSLWAYHTLKEGVSEEVADGLIGLLTPGQREDISFRTDRRNAYIPANWFNEDGQPWGMKFSTCVLQRILAGTNYVSKEEAERVAVYFPVEMSVLIRQKVAAFNDQESIPSRMCHLILNYMELKQSIDTLFTDKI